MAGTMSTMTAAQAALRDGSHEQARAGFEVVARESQDPAAYEELAQAAWWLDDADQCLRAREQAYRRYRAAGDVGGAARAATALAWDSLLFGQGTAVARGWLGRARELLAPQEESVEHGWLAVREAEQALSLDHDPAAGLVAAERASAIGRRLRIGDLEVTGLALSGLALTGSGEVRAGMDRLDTAAASATCGDVEDPMWMGKICCWLIAACHDTHDLGRAMEWCRRVEVICTEQNLVPLLNVCRIQYASLQVARGSWEDAERELTGALDRLSVSRRTSRLDAVVQLGELRRRQGRFAEADALLAQAEFLPAAVVGRALIRFAQGDAPGAWSSVTVLLQSLPVADRIERSSALLAAVRIATAVDDLGAARESAEELRETATAAGTHALLAMSACADATLADAGQADAGMAVSLWREAVHRFHLAGLRFDEAETRLQLASALLVAQDVAGAREQIATSTAALTELSATAGLALARHLAAQAGRRTSPLTARETEVLRLVSHGLNNQQIAATLVVSEHTVHRHVANILNKLGQTSRTAATAHALNNGLL